MASNMLDPSTAEKGEVHVNDHPFSNATSIHAVTSANNTIQYPPGTTPLTLFQALIGITTSSELGGSDKVQRPRLIVRRIFFPPKYVGGSNLGLYQRAINNEWKNRIAYYLSSYILNILFILQILLAATFTALSASKTPNRSADVSLTVLGAINTVVAGILAWLKGQGIPNRFRRARDQYSNIVREIEIVERKFSEAHLYPYASSGELNPWKEAERLRGLFNQARVDQQMNYPDMYVSSQDTTMLSEKATKDAENLKTEMATKTDELKTEFGRREEELMERIRVLEGLLTGIGARPGEEMESVRASSSSHHR